jgi:hypothetical protein
LLVELFLLLLRPEVLFGRVVRFVVTRESEFRCGHMHRVRNIRCVGRSPECVEPRSFGSLDGSGSSRNDATGTDRSDNLHDLFVFPFRGEESRFGFGSARERSLENLRGEVRDGRFIRVVV